MKPDRPARMLFGNCRRPRNVDCKLAERLQPKISGIRLDMSKLALFAPILFCLSPISHSEPTPKFGEFHIKPLAGSLRSTEKSRPENSKRSSLVGEMKERLHIGAYSPSDIPIAELGGSSSLEFMQKNGFTVAGPWYSSAAASKENAIKAIKRGLKIALHGGPFDGKISNEESRDRVNFNSMSSTNDATKFLLQSRAIRENLCCWLVLPEELRMWRRTEENYLEQIVTAIQEASRKRIPIGMYEPNSRPAKFMKRSGNHLDLLFRGIYLSQFGYSPERAITLKNAMREVNQTIAVTRQHPIAVLELFQDIPGYSAEDIEESNEKREQLNRMLSHDVFLAIAEGAGGIHLWSMWHKRPNLSTFSSQLKAYGNAFKLLRRIEPEILTGGDDCDSLFQLATPEKKDEKDVTVNTLGKDALSTWCRSIGDSHTLLIINSSLENTELGIRLPEGSWTMEKLSSNARNDVSERHSKNISLSMKPFQTLVVRLRLFINGLE